MSLSHMLPDATSDATVPSLLPVPAPLEQWLPVAVWFDGRHRWHLSSTPSVSFVEDLTGLHGNDTLFTRWKLGRQVRPWNPHSISAINISSDSRQSLSVAKSVSCGLKGKMGQVIFKVPLVPELRPPSPNPPGTALNSEDD